MGKLNNFINRHHGVILLLSALAGLFLNLEKVETSMIILISLATVIFSSLFRINLSAELYKSDWINILIFFSIRFILFPIIVYFLIVPFSPFFSLCFFLLLLLPSAVSSPAISAMYQGDISVVLKVLLFTSFASILTITGLLTLILSKNISIDTNYLFLIMIYTIAVPFIAHIPFRKSKLVFNFFIQNNALITTVGLMAIFLFSTSKNRLIILKQPDKIFLYTGIAFLFFALFYLIGYFIIPRIAKSKRIALSISSGANNMGMGVTLTMLFFPGETNVFFIITQFASILVLISMKYFYRKIRQ